MRLLHLVIRKCLVPVLPWLLTDTRLPMALSQKIFKKKFSTTQITKQYNIAIVHIMNEA